MAQLMPRTYWLHHSLVSGANLKASLQRSPTLGPLSIESWTEATWVHNIFPLSTSTIYFIVLKKSYNSPTSCIIISPHEVSLISNTKCMCKQNNLETASEQCTHLSNFTFGSTRTRWCWMRSFTTLRALELLVRFVLNHFASFSRDGGIRLQK